MAVGFISILQPRIKLFILLCPMRRVLKRSQSCLDLVVATILSHITCLASSHRVAPSKTQSFPRPYHHGNGLLTAASMSPAAMSSMLSAQTLVFPGTGLVLAAPYLPLFLLKTPPNRTQLLSCHDSSVTRCRDTQAALTSGLFRLLPVFAITSLPRWVEKECC